MSTKQQAKAYIDSHPEPKRSELQQLHAFMLKVLPGCKLWFDDGRNQQGKAVTNPTIGYGSFIIRYASGETKEFFQIGISANTAGISVYILGLKDKNYLKQHFGKTIGKAGVTGYCIKFKSVHDIHLPVLEQAVRYGVENT